MILVDSSGWIEHLTDRPLADQFEKRLATADLLVPTVVVYEVYKFLRRETSLDAAERAVVLMQERHVVPLDEQVAIEAADFSLEHGLAMADAVVYATARHHDATLVTMDEDFRELPGTEVLGGDQVPSGRSANCRASSRGRRSRG